jgi:hypothetical protein
MCTKYTVGNPEVGKKLGKRRRRWEGNICNGFQKYGGNAWSGFM